MRTWLLNLLAPGMMEALQNSEAELVKARDRLRAVVDAQAVEIPKPMPRGAVVTRMVLNPQSEFAQALDEYPLADYWEVSFTGDAKDAFLSLMDVNGMGIATYKPGTWDRVETGTAENIKTKVEAPNQP